MSAEKKPPIFVKPGDDPSLDHLLTAIKQEGDEKDSAYFYDMLGRRRKKEGEADVGAVPPSKRWWGVVAVFAIVAMAAPVLVVVAGRGPRSKPAGLDQAASALPALSMMAVAPHGAPSAAAPGPSAAPSASATVAPAVPSGTQGRVSPVIKDDDPYVDPQNKPDAGRKPRPIIHW